MLFLHKKQRKSCGLKMGPTIQNRQARDIENTKP